MKYKFKSIFQFLIGFINCSEPDEPHPIPNLALTPRVTWLDLIFPSTVFPECRRVQALICSVSPGKVLNFPASLPPCLYTGVRRHARAVEGLTAPMPGVGLAAGSAGGVRQGQVPPTPSRVCPLSMALPCPLSGAQAVSLPSHAALRAPSTRKLAQISPLGAPHPVTLPRGSHHETGGKEQDKHEIHKAGTQLLGCKR